MTGDELRTEQSVKRTLGAARLLAPEISPYLKTRVLAELREREHARRLTGWKRLAILSPAFSMLAVALVIWTMGRTGDSYAAHLNEHVLVRVEVESLQNQGIRY